jgi:hypothetical protein
MIQRHTCVSVRCDQCGDALGSPEFEAHYRTERAALRAATAARWRASSGGRVGVLGVRTGPGLRGRGSPVQPVASSGSAWGAGGGE